MNSSNRKRLLKSIDIISRLIEHILAGKALCPMPYRDSFYHIFYEQRELNRFFVDLFPNDKLDKFSHILSIVTSASGSIGREITSSRGSITDIQLKENLCEIRDVLTASLNSDFDFNIFYSWESDLQGSTNRNFIESALEKAIKQLKTEFGVSIKLDKDTREVTGSPDIVRAILEKIDKCFMFVADVSILTNKNDKFFPNPNVMFELGYAIKTISDENVIMVFNDATGTTRNLPFDLGLKRQMKYSCPSDISPENKKDEKEKLTRDLYNAIKLRLQLELSE